MNKNLKDRADILLQRIYLDGYEHGYKEAIQSISNYMAIDKITAEIKDLKKSSLINCVSNFDVVDTVLEIIDKNTGDRNHE